MDSTINTPRSEQMVELCQFLFESAPRWSQIADWPLESLVECGKAGVFRWFVPEEQGGFGWCDREQTEGYLKLAEADLVTTFVITQYMGAIRRIAASENRSVAEEWLPPLMAGQAFATVGISHLTTSRRHLSEPVLTAKKTSSGYELSGLSPWVTGAVHADLFVVGATLEDGKQVLLAVPSSTKGITAKPGVELVALSASCTDQVIFDRVEVESSMVLAGPINNVLQSGVGARTGGLQTSTLAVGLATAAAKYLGAEAEKRDDLREPSRKLQDEVNGLRNTLLLACDGSATKDAGEIRAEANRIVLRSTQAALMAAKGAGFVEGHPAGRWCRQALFFLVWSCPQPISHAHLCELASGAESLDFG